MIESDWTTAVETVTVAEPEFRVVRPAHGLASPLVRVRIGPRRVTGTLLGFFLERGTSRRPRSLATKALHFAAPRTFAIGDNLACDQLAGELGASRWDNATVGLDAQGMSLWWCDYMSVLRAIGEDSRELIHHLMLIDQVSGALPLFERVRGLPKLLDKILWWAGRVSDRGADIELFRKKGSVY